MYSWKNSFWPTKFELCNNLLLGQVGKHFGNPVTHEGFNWIFPTPLWFLVNNALPVLASLETFWNLFCTIFPNFFTFKHGTIIQLGITCKKICCYKRESASRWLIVENAKIFWSYVKQFWIFLRERNCRILIALCE